MKKLFVMLLFMASTLFANAIQWENIQTAIKTAKQSKKPIVLFLSSSNCKYCKKMMNETFTNPSVITEIKQEYVAAKVVIDRERYLPIQVEQMLQATQGMVPSLWILEPYNLDPIVQGRLGFVESAPLLKELKEAASIYAMQQAKGY
jgi:thiol-disulfide isomerase/thioredoxin